MEYFLKESSAIGYRQRMWLTVPLKKPVFCDYLQSDC